MNRSLRWRLGKGFVSASWRFIFRITPSDVEGVKAWVNNGSLKWRWMTAAERVTYAIGMVIYAGPRGAREWWLREDRCV